ncbi:NADH-quinone oxidoreductase subunit J [bacterium]|nr:NADH-quinone oxidoreductase subunit J [bacterium]
METTVNPVHLFFVNPLFYFWVFSFALLGAAVGVVMMRNIVHCTLSLCLAFICTAGIYVIFGAEFLAAAEILIYAGAVTVLIFFALMLSKRIIGRDIIYKNRQSIWAMLLSMAMALVLIATLAYGNWNYEVDPTVAPMDNTKMIGRSLMLSYTLVFWVTGFILTITMIGALMLAKKD